MSLAKVLIFTGLGLVALGLLVWCSHKLPEGFQLGNLPLDIRLEMKWGTFYFPLATSLILSLIVSAIVHLVRRFF